MVPLIEWHEEPRDTHGNRATGAIQCIQGYTHRGWACTHPTPIRTSPKSPGLKPLHPDTKPRAPHARTQLFACEGQEGGVFIQVLVEVNAKQTQLLLDALDLLQNQEEV